MDATNIRWLELEKFVGRKTEISKFQKILDNPKGKQRTLYIRALGGQGKTWLIKKMLLIAEEQPNVIALKPDQLVDMYSTSNRHIEGVMQALEQRLVQTMGNDEAFLSYREACQELENARALEEYSQDEISDKVNELKLTFRRCLETVTERKIVVIAFDTFENVDTSEVKEWVLSRKGLQMPNLVCLIGSRSPWKEEDEIHYDSVKLIELGGLSNNDAVDLYLSYTGETLSAINEDRKKFIHILNEKSQKNPLMLGLSIIYLDTPNNRPEEIKKLTPTEFEKEVVSWLSIRNGPPGSVHFGAFIFNEQIRQALVLMSYLNRRFDRYFLEKLCENGYIQMEDAAIDEVWQELEDRKPELFFVKERQGGEIQLHDKLAELLRKYILIDAFSDITGERLREFTNNVVTWYSDRIETANPSEKDVLSAEQFSYLLRSDLIVDCQGHYGVLPEICQKINYLAPLPDQIVSYLENYRRQRSDILARLIIGEIKLPLIERFFGNKRYEVYCLFGYIAKQCYEQEVARKFFELAFEEAKSLGDSGKQVESLLDQHNSTFQFDPNKSLQILDEAEKICKIRAKNLLPQILYEKGFTYSIMNDLLKASKWYAEAKEAAKQYKDKVWMPIILNDEGYNFLLIGDLVKARTSIRAARDHRYRKYLQLKRKLSKSNSSFGKQQPVAEEDVREAAKMLGLSYSTLGDLARYSSRLDEALTRYQEAMKNFRYSHSRYWQFKMYIVIGETCRRIAVTDFIAGRLSKYKKMDRQAEVNIKQSIDLGEKYGFRGDLDTVYRRLGRLYHDRMFRTKNPHLQIAYLDDARRYFRQALSIAKNTNDQLEILENLTELAFLADDYLAVAKLIDSSRYETEIINTKQDIDDLKNYINDCPKHNRVYQFPVFVHLLEIEQAAYLFALGDFKDALTLYIKGYVGMANLPGYGVARYLQHIDHLVGQLTKLFKQDEKEAQKWCSKFLTVWEQKGLTERRPELPESIHMISDTNFLF